MRGSLAALVLSTAAPSPSPAAGALTWDAPLPECPSAEVVSQRLESLLGARALAVAAVARVRPAGSGLRLDLHVQWRGRVDARVLEADTCESLAEATVVLVALMAESPRDGDTGAPAELDTESLLPNTTPDPSAPDTSAAPESVPHRVDPPALHPPLAPAPEPIADDPPLTALNPSEPPAHARSRHPREFALALLGLLDIGSIAGVSGGLGLTLGWHLPRLRLFVTGAYLPPRGLPLDTAYAAKGRVQLGLVQLGACARLGPARIEVPLCGALEVGGTRATRFGLLADRGARDPWLALAAGPALVVTLSRVLALVVRLEAVLPIFRSRYVYGDEAVLHETAPVALRGGLGLEFRPGRATKQITKPRPNSAPAGE